MGHLKVRYCERLRARVYYYPLTVSIYVACVLALLYFAGKPFVYPLDDTYIHMAIARTLAAFGVWGAGPTTPAAASSSPLWTLLLTGFYLMSPSAAFIYVPVLLNLVSGCGLILLLMTIFEERTTSVALVVTICWAAALPSLSLLGMEHVLHILIALALCFFGSRAIADASGESDIRTVAGLGLVAAAAVAARYESLFLVAPLAAFAATRQRWRLAAALAAGATAPVLGFGLLWIHNGGWLLPNSLLLKTDLTKSAGAASSISDITARFLENRKEANTRYEFSAILVIAATSFLVYCARFKTIWGTPAIFAFCVLFATLAHLAFASVGWLFRYEAYLIVLNIAAIFLVSERLVGPRSLLVLAALIAVVFAVRTAKATYFTVLAVNDRRLEHLAPALFVEANYPGRAVMVNDLGAMAWFAPRSTVLDIYGLGNNEPVRLRLSPEGYTRAALRDWAARTDAQIAILQVCWSEVSSRLPEEWALIATWRIPRNVVFGDRMVGFFALKRGADKELGREIAEFRLPEGVQLKMRPLRSEMADQCPNQGVIPQPP